jgi:hypothetical protein
VVVSVIGFSFGQWPSQTHITSSSELEVKAEI